MVSPLEDSSIGRDRQCQSNSSSDRTMLMPTTTDKETNFVNFSSISNSKPRLKSKEDYLSNHHILVNSFSSSTVSTDIFVHPDSGNQTMINSHQNRRMGKNTKSYENASSSVVPQNCEISRSMGDSWHGRKTRIIFRKQNCRK
ncbi:two-component response regulator ORR22 isoform X2 [Canna indica]|uniref:Two-component response regulator ORR22 isoform X2 n=1 Tax=Canna indica TaxID=4628 RepID=A0AAQ3KGX6_9LILI|nr:two-component response regulator ORR22 isoform X2 [Canna indica]